MSDTQVSASARAGTGVLGLLAVLLTVLFVALQLTGVISWSWWAVLAPILIYFGLGIAVFALFLVGFGIFLLVLYLNERRKR